MPNPSIVALIVSEISVFIRTDGQTDMARSTRLVILAYFMGSETLPSACYILSDESSISSYSTSNGYNKGERYSQVPGLSDTRYLAKGNKGKWRYASSKSTLKCTTYPRSQYMVMWAVDRFKHYGR